MRAALLLAAIATAGVVLWLLATATRSPTVPNGGASGLGHGPAALGQSAASAELEASSSSGPSATRARAAEGELVVGHVESTVDGTRLAGWRVVVWSSDGVQGSGESGADGTFGVAPTSPLTMPATPVSPSTTQSVPAPTTAGSTEVAVEVATVRAHPPAGAGFAPTEPFFSVLREPSGALRPVVVRAAPIQRGTFARSLVDEATGEPVPFCEVELVCDDWGRVRATSDAQGVVRLDVDLPSGTADVRVLDHALAAGARFLPSVRVEVGARSATPAPLAVRVGPTFRLQLECSEPFAPEELSVSFGRARGPQRDWSDGWTVPVRLDGDAGPWVRTRPYRLIFPFDDPALHGPYALELRHDAGLIGSVELPRLEGVHPTPLVVRLTRVGALRGRVLDQDGAPVGDARVSLFDGAQRGLVVEQTTAANGAFVFSAVQAGDHVLRAFTRSHGTVVKAVALASGETRELELTLTRRPVGRIAGTARTVTGGIPPAAVHLQLTPLGTAGDVELAGLVFFAFLEWDAAAARARFDFGELPVGRYELLVVAHAGPPWEPARLELEGPNDALELLCRNDIAELPLVASGAPAERYFRAQVGGVWLSQRLSEGRIVLPTTDETEVEEWALLERGKRAARGNGWQLERATEGPDIGALLVAAPLEPGYARVVFVTQHGAPLQGVSVRVDGVRVGVTDVDGGLLVEAEGVPRVSLDLPGHRRGTPSDDGFELRFAVERE
jgi:hypothetical protein